MMVDKRKLTVREKADYLPAFLSISGAAVAAPITASFRGPDGADTFKHHIVHAIIRKFNSRLSSLQSQSFQPTFEGIYQKWCKSNNIEPEVVTTKTGLKGAWVGDKQKARYVVIYYHGGGFALDGSEGHLDFWHSVQTELEYPDSDSPSISTAFFYVFYTLTPHRVYPTQLRESIAALQYVTEELSILPSSILLAGDSAGGNLAASVLLHLTHPCPDIEPTVSSSSPAPPPTPPDQSPPTTPYTTSTNLKGLILMAPWVSLDTSWPSFTTNRKRDYLSAEVEARWAREYTVTHPHDIWTDPATAPASCWEAGKVSDILVTVGSHEMLIDGIKHWVEKYQSVRDGGIELVVAEGEVHIAPIVWPIFGEKRETVQAREIKRWMREKLK